MSEMLTNGAEAVVILSFFFGIFRYVVLKPLNVSIEELRRCIDDMRSNIKTEHERREELYNRLMLCEHDVKAANKRLDSLGTKPEYVLGGDDA